MIRRQVRSTLLTAVAVAGCFGAVAAAGAQAVRPLAIDTARVTIAGTSNIHAYTASTTAVRVTRASLAGAAAGQGFWDTVTKPGVIEAFDVAIAASQLSSPKDGLDKNMHKALKVQEHPDIIFRLTGLEAAPAGGALKARGVLRIAGVEREVVLDLT